MSSGLIDQLPRHPLVSLVADVRARLDETTEAPAWTLTPAELASLLPEIARAEAQLAGVRLRMLREAERHHLEDTVGATSTAAWWANTTRTTKPAAHRAVKLAEGLDESAHEATAAALGRGEVSVDQAAVILDAVDALPTELVDTSLRRQAETNLVALAAHYNPKELRILGRRILDVLAPEIAEEHERKVLEAEEQHAAATAMFSIRSDGHGSLHGRFKIPDLTGEILVKHLNAIAAPKHQRAVAGDDAPAAYVSRPLRLGQAFIEYLETRAAQGMPKAGGVPATVVVTMTLDVLLGKAQTAALLDTGESISASAARRLACRAGIIPAVLDGKSMPLDVGREQRFHTRYQRIAMTLRDKGCTAAGCDWPPGMCHVGFPWLHGHRHSGLLGHGEVFA